MIRRLRPLLIGTAILLVGHTPLPAQVAGWKPDQSAEPIDRGLYENATAARTSFLEADPDLRAFFDQAFAYVVFPTVGKGGMGLGGARGKGVYFQGGTPMGESTLTQVTIGFQWGGQAYSEAIFFKDAESAARFREGNFELAAQASAVAATLGASRDVSYEGGVAIFTMAKGGLMYEASVGGQKLSFSPRRPPQ